MNFPLKKINKIIQASFLTLPLIFMAGTSNAAESVDERIKKLESLVKELQQIKKKETKKSQGNAKHSYKFGGYIKATATFTDYSDGELASGSGLRDLYIPAAIPVGGVGESQDFDFGAKESRINFKSNHLLENGSTLTTTIEMDFLFPPGGNERVSNSYNPRVRHAFFTYNNWLFGQTWSTFQDVVALPESADFLAASDGIIFVRQAMARYTNGPWQLALENPESTVTPYGGGGRIVTDDNSRPDIIARYNHKAEWGHVTVSALLRELEFNNGSNSESTSATGISVTSKLKVGAKNDIRVNFATGTGMGRYVGLNTANGAVLDASGNLDAIDSTLGTVAYRHHWNNEWRSNFILSAMQIDNDTSLTGTAVTESVGSFQINLLYSPVPKLTMGVGYLSASRQIEAGAEGDLDRVIFIAKYGF